MCGQTFQKKGPIKQKPVKREKYITIYKPVYNIHNTTHYARNSCYVIEETFVLSLKSEHAFQKYRNFSSLSDYWKPNTPRLILEFKSVSKKGETMNYNSLNFFGRKIKKSLNPVPTICQIAKAPLRKQQKYFWVQTNMRNKPAQATLSTSANNTCHLL